MAAAYACAQMSRGTHVAHEASTPRPRVPRAVAGVAIAGIAIASVVALLWPSLPFNASAAQEAAGPTSVGVIRRDIEEPGQSGQVGARAPDFEWNTPTGQTARLSDLQGKVVVVNFWATWCLPCREEMPAFERVAGASPDATFLAVDLQESGDKVRAFFNQLGLREMRPLLDTNGSVTRRFGVLSFPTTFYLDGRGIIRHVEIGGQRDEVIARNIAKARNP